MGTVRWRRWGGFTLIETLIAAAILAVSVAAIAHAITAGHAQTEDSLHRARAVALAEAMLEEVLSKPYRDPSGATTIGPDSGETSRALFDNIDDYHGYPSKADDAGIDDALGESYGPEYEGFTRRVTVEAKSVLSPRGEDLMPGMLITVEVRDQAGATWVVTRFVEAPK